VERFVGLGLQGAEQGSDFHSFADVAFPVGVAGEDVRDAWIDMRAGDAEEIFGGPDCREVFFRFVELEFAGDEIKTRWRNVEVRGCVIGRLGGGWARVLLDVAAA